MIEKGGAVWEALSDVVPNISVLIALSILLSQVLRDRREHHRIQSLRAQENEMRVIADLILEMWEHIEPRHGVISPSDLRESTSNQDSCAATAKELIGSLRKARRLGLRSHLLGNHPLSERRPIYHNRAQTLHNQFMASLERIARDEPLNDETRTTCRSGLIRLAHSCLIYDTATFKGELAPIIFSNLSTVLPRLRMPYRRDYERSADRSSARRLFRKLLRARSTTPDHHDRAIGEGSLPRVFLISGDQAIQRSTNFEDITRHERKQEELYRENAHNLLWAWEYLAPQANQEAIVSLQHLWNCCYSLLESRVPHDRYLHAESTSLEPSEREVLANLGRSTSSPTRYLDISDETFLIGCDKLLSLIEGLEKEGLQNRLARSDTDSRTVNESREQHWVVFKEAIKDASHSTAEYSAELSESKFDVESQGVARLIESAIICLVASSIELANDLLLSIHALARVHQAQDSDFGIDDAAATTRAFKCIGFDTKQIQDLDVLQCANIIRQADPDVMPQVLQEARREYDSIPTTESKSISSHLAGEEPHRQLTGVSVLRKIDATPHRRRLTRWLSPIRALASKQSRHHSSVWTGEALPDIEYDLANDVSVLLQHVREFATAIVADRDVRQATYCEIRGAIEAVTSALKVADRTGISHRFKGKHPSGDQDLTDLVWSAFRNALRELQLFPPDDPKRDTYTRQDFVMGVIRLARRCSELPDMDEELAASLQVPDDLVHEAWNYLYDTDQSDIQPEDVIVFEIARCVYVLFERIRELSGAVVGDQSVATEFFDQVNQLIATLSQSLVAMDRTGRSDTLGGSYSTIEWSEDDPIIEDLLWDDFRNSLATLHEFPPKQPRAEHYTTEHFVFGLMRLGEACNEWAGTRRLGVSEDLMHTARNYRSEAPRDLLILKISRSSIEFLDLLRALGNAMVQQIPVSHEDYARLRLTIASLVRTLKVADYTGLSEELNRSSLPGVSNRTQRLWTVFCTALAELDLSPPESPAPEDYTSQHLVMGAIRLAQRCSELVSVDATGISDELLHMAWNYLDGAQAGED